MKADKKLRLTRPERRPPGRSCPPIKPVPIPQGFQGYCCSLEPWDCFTHWNPGTKRTEPCVQGKKLCPGHLANMPLRYKAYLHMYAPHTKTEFFVELTALACERLEVACEGHTSLRGLLLQFKREYNDKRATVITTLLGRWTHEDVLLPQPKTPEITLSAIFGIDLVG